MSLLAHTSGYSTDTNGVTSGSIDTTGAKRLVIIAACYNTVSPSVSDSKSNLGWTKDAGTIHASNSAVSVWSCKPTTVGAGHTFSLSGSGIYPSICVFAFSDDVVADQTNTGGASSTTAACGSVTPSANDSIVIDAVACWGAAVAAQPSSIDSSQSATDLVAEYAPGGSTKAYGCGAAYEIQTTATTRNPTWTCNAFTSDIATAIVTYKPAPSFTETGQMFSVF